MTMKSFNNYSAYYNLLYQDKDYKAEALYVHQLIQKWNPGAKTILNLGCGTGKHDLLLAEMGYALISIDLSQTMIDIAKLENTHSNIEYHVGDVRDFEFNRQFDVVVSLFHVMSYQTTIEELSAAFRTAKNHLEINGAFIFDCWYGPGVESDPPKHVTKNVEDENIRVHRKTTPIHLLEKHIVKVQFEVKVEEKNSTVTNVFKEIHPMRYWFNDEIDIISNQVGLSCQEFYKWMTFNKPIDKDWYTVNILKQV
jgi:SAM-dependent methyltransferase